MPLILLKDFKHRWECIGADLLLCAERVGQIGYLILGPEDTQFEKDPSSY